MKTYCFILFCSLLLQIEFYAQPIELGKVKWNRDYEQAVNKAKVQTKPMLVLFQEVPGCATCRNYGQKVLSHPLIVEAIETYFIPLCIYNNKTGKDKTILDKFNEPSWNNPVIRIFDTNGKELVKRISNIYSDHYLVSQINSCLIGLGIAVPEYLMLLEKEMLAAFRGSEQLTLGMHCFWSGEQGYGQLEGIISTKALYADQGEAVEISFDPKLISLDQIIQYGQSKGIADRLYLKPGQGTSLNIKTVRSKNMRQDPETKYYLFKSPYKAVPMTAFQAMKANALLAQGHSCHSVLSPRQIAYSLTLQKKSVAKLPNHIGQDIFTSWASCMP